MRIVLLGPPGSGKGTEAKLLSGKLGIPHISTGDILRQAMAEGKELGQKVRSYVEGGGLVPDELMIDLIEHRIGEGDCRSGFILDGFPRTLAQAEALGRSLGKVDSPLDLVINLEASTEVLVDRLSGRRICRQCQAIFHINNMPPEKEGICDHCGGELYQRDDDREEVVRKRLKLYQSEIQSLLDYYQRKNILEAVNSEQGPRETLEKIWKVIESHKR